MKINGLEKLGIINKIIIIISPETRPDTQLTLVRDTRFSAVS